MNLQDKINSAKTRILELRISNKTLGKKRRVDKKRKIR